MTKNQGKSKKNQREEQEIEDLTFKNLTFNIKSPIAYYLLPIIPLLIITLIRVRWNLGLTFHRVVPGAIGWRPFRACFKILFISYSKGI
ncbi:hypothetical protein SAMN05421856_103504 [Chryseobacterium taichungense]|uniref:Uncharacterized protein n=1 Tax=Chryseobacterium taichungense TaxID=295069 RepID=A0A1H7YRM2_9FLAO|nr:hypothetical protein SAMN05421856_103504 [Chryseobacterium taichungense]